VHPTPVKTSGSELALTGLAALGIVFGDIGTSPQATKIAVASRCPERFCLAASSLFFQRAAAAFRASYLTNRLPKYLRLFSPPFARIFCMCLSVSRTCTLLARMKAAVLPANPYRSRRQSGPMRGRDRFSLKMC
jgi:hypothetical protein